jgi:hypothetical protein
MVIAVAIAGPDQGSVKKGTTLRTTLSATSGHRGEKKSCLPVTLLLMASVSGIDVLSQRLRPEEVVRKRAELARNPGDSR